MEENLNENPFGMDDENEKNYTSKRVEFNERNYLADRLKEGEKSREIKIRILPFTEGKADIFLQIKSHPLKVNKEIARSGFKSFICLNYSEDEQHEKKCPICKKYEELAEKAKEYTDEVERKAKFKEAFAYRAKTTYIVRVIERGKEGDGVKFWRFNKHDDGKGIYDKLKNIYEQRCKEHEENGMGKYNVYNLYKGHDIVLKLTRDSRNKTAIEIIDETIEKPLSKDENQIKEWVNNSKRWQDMYSTKSIEYLEIVANGEVPIYSKELGKFVPKDLNEDISDRVESEAVMETLPYIEPQPNSNNEVEEELPF